MSGRKIAGIALVVGAPTYVVAELIKRQGDIGSSGLSAMVENPGLSHAMAQLSILGLVLTLAGLFTFWRDLGDGDHAVAFISRLSLLSLTIGFTGFVLSNGLDHVNLHILTHDNQSTAEVRVQMVDTIASTRAGIVVVSGTMNFFGSMLLAVSLAAAAYGLPAFQRVTARVMAAVFLVGLATHIGAEHLHTALLYSVTGLATFLAAVWYITLGVGIIRDEGDPAEAHAPITA